MAKTWMLDHDPEARPLGCNGKYGSSGRGRHKYYGTPVCDACKASDNHYCRELRRGQNMPRKKPLPCGTPAAAYQHRLKGERLDMACVEAEIQGKRDYRARKNHPHVKPELALLYEEGTRLTASILQRRKRRCISNRKHTPDHCKHCGVHVPKGQVAGRAKEPAMNRCNKCGHHHIQGKTPTPCNGINEDEDGGISRCRCTHTNEQENQCAA